MCQAATKLRAHFLALLTPIRNSITTNLNMLQTSLFSKYRPLFAFLQRQAPQVASEVQRAYVGTVRTYFETGFRRYIRSLGWIKVRYAFLEAPKRLMIRFEGSNGREIGYYRDWSRRWWP